MRLDRSSLRCAYAAFVLLCSAAMLPSASDVAHAAEGAGPAARRGGGTGASAGCLWCHEGIEDMHPEAELSCVDCHGGDDTTTEKLAAHVQPMRPDPGDERVASLDGDPGYRRFVNPMDLRIVDRTCGTCHPKEVYRVHGSLHGSTAGHLSDGYYEMGLFEERGSRYGVFPVSSLMAERGGPGEPRELVQVPPFDDRAPRDELATHYTDLVRKECMQCHLWSSGRAVRGRIGFDGDYRGQGCAACHVEYALDGLSESADRSVERNEPGHPRTHAMTRAPTTQTCTSCHYGDASIGLGFRGLSQLPPGAPGGPDIAGTTDTLLNRAFYLDDNSMAPPDVHHQKGMHCIDCHTENDVMGDGALHGQMEYAVEISCADCHGTFAEPVAKRTDSDRFFRTERGTILSHLRWEGERVVMISKVDGQKHPVPQVAHVLDPEHGDYNARAAEAMTPAHGRLECYVCHNAWNINFLGFHFDRNESLTQLDLLSGGRTPGRVTTQEKVFATWKSFYAGWNSEGRIAPYLTGFSTMGTVRDSDGELILDQALPVTAAGLSGVTMIHHQMHTNRKTSRRCIECHRTSTTWGMGSVNFRLGRQLAFVADRRGIEVVALNRKQLSASSPLAKFVLPDVVDIELLCDPLQGEAQYLFATEGYRGVHVLDVRKPTAPERVAFVAELNPRGMRLSGDHLFVANGVGGLVVYDVSDPREPERVGQLPLFDAHEVAIQWPWAYVADGVGGLSIVDVRAPIAPKLVGALRLGDEPDDVDAAIDVDVLFQYSRPLTERGGEPADRRTEARNLCAVLDEERGLVLVDVTEPTHPRRVYPPPGDEGPASFAGTRPPAVLVPRARARQSRRSGGAPRRSGHLRARLRLRLGEYALGNGNRRSQLFVLDVTEPEQVEVVGNNPTGNATEMLRLAWFYNPPFLQSMLFAPGEQGVLMTDASISAEPNPVGALAAMEQAYAIAVEEFPLDQMVDGAGRVLKDVSHEGARWPYRAEIERLLDVSGEELGTLDASSAKAPAPGITARLHLARLDEDRTGLLEGAEFERGGGAEVDADGDGRIVLAELAGLAGLHGSGTAAESPPQSQFLRTRVDEDGDLARLLDGVNPYDHDKDGDRLLSERELRAAFFAALDLDGDERLSPDELSRQPGPTRELRYGGEAARRLFREYDPNNDRKIALREYRVPAPELAAIDKNGDGSVQLFVPTDTWWEQRGFVGPESEWPTRQPIISYLPPIITAEKVLAAFDQDRDGELSRRELRRRPDLFQEFERDGDDVIQLEEIERRVDLISARGVDVTADGYVARWDLDGNEKVEGDEIPPGAELRVD